MKTKAIKFNQGKFNIIKKQLDRLKTIALVEEECQRQDERWGEQNHDDYRWIAILSEEVGELAQAILHDEFGGAHAGTMKEELAQVAAVAMQWLEALERREGETAVSEEGTPWQTKKQSGGN